jgi:soluble lytic murein transglycosylase-like protein
MTQYGQAFGSMQVQDATGQEMAQKLGLPWRPDLMRGTSQEAAQYQRTIGNAYLQEGLQKTGNLRDALHYYHGGPNRKLWGPKTRRYADEVLGRL